MNLKVTIKIEYEDANAESATVAVATVKSARFGNLACPRLPEAEGSRCVSFDERFSNYGRGERGSSSSDCRGEARAESMNSRKARRAMIKPSILEVIAEHVEL